MKDVEIPKREKMVVMNTGFSKTNSPSRPRIKSPLFSHSTNTYWTPTVCQALGRHWHMALKTDVLVPWILPFKWSPALWLRLDLGCSEEPQCWSEAVAVRHFGALVSLSDPARFLLSRPVLGVRATRLNRCWLDFSHPKQWWKNHRLLPGRRGMVACNCLAPSWPWQCEIRASPAVWEQSLPTKPFISQNGVKRRSSYLRIHLANGCTK